LRPRQIDIKSSVRQSRFHPPFPDLPMNVSSKLKTLNDTFFKCYEAHVLKTKMIDSSEREIRIKQTIIVADMTEIHMILNLL
jgi:hypothetical protein